MIRSKLSLVAICAVGLGLAGPAFAQDYFLDGLISPRPVLIAKKPGPETGTDSPRCDIALYAPLLAESSDDTPKLNDLILRHVGQGIKAYGLNCKKYLSAWLAYKVTRADKWTSMNIVLYVRPRETVKGGFESLPMTIDTERVNIVPLKALFKSPNYLKIVDDQLSAHVLPAMAKKGVVYAFKPTTARQKFYLTAKDLVICYDQYEIGPGVAGVVELPIPLASLRRHLIPGLSPLR
ncbi:MAG: RsiV family protein [Pseudomonadota bacterium]